MLVAALGSHAMANGGLGLWLFAPWPCEPQASNITAPSLSFLLCKLH